MKRNTARFLSVAVSILLIPLMIGGCMITTGPVFTAMPSASHGVPASAGASASPAAVLTPTREPPAQATPTPVPTPAPIPTVNLDSIRVDDQYVTVNLTFPVLANLADEAFQASFNDAVRADMQGLADRLHADAVADYDGLGPSERAEFRKYSLESDVELRYADGKLISLSNNLYEDRGGAHGSPDERFYTVVNSIPARQLKLRDLFTDPAEGMRRVQRAVDEAIAREPEIYFDPPEATVGESSWFCVTGTSLHVVFPVYVIAPYASGEPDFEISLSDLSDILIPELRH